jgi:type IX secretion system PorP/SprF family membrane protein
MREIVLFVLFFIMSSMNAQPMAQYNLYPYNPDFANPAATGISNCLEMIATEMHQWLGIADAPTIQSFSIQQGRQFSRTKKHGLGANLVRDANGPSKSLGGELIYSFHILIARGRSTWLSFGLSGSVEQRKLDESGFSPVYDPRITGGIDRELVYNASSGIYLYNKKCFAGAAMYNLLPINSTLGMGYGSDRFYMSVQGGYQFESRRLPVKILTSVQGNRGIDII